MRRSVCLLASALALALAGCGSERQRAPDLLSVRPPFGAVPVSFPDAGMSFAAPANWRREPRRPPGVFALASGEAQVVGWAYERKEPLPRRGRRLESARKRLVARVRRLGFRVAAAKTGELDGAPVIEIAGEQTISRRRLRVRSVHVFRGEAEYVIEALVPPARFELVDREVLAPLLRTLELTGRIRRGR